MSAYMERAKQLRASTSVHYNCAQSVLVPFAEQQGYTAEQACAFAAAFGQGMQTANLCGAFTGALMALGVCGKADRKSVVALTRRMKQNHDGTLLCAELLRKNAETGGERKPHCDAMVFEAVELVEELLSE
ncbi:MAG: C_GCAxxG_C_C family protein [Atopobiaceae bacterium]|nr:C_GCAxxG_C_C family protein [Atopobiaceae bacterium]